MSTAEGDQGGGGDFGFHSFGDGSEAEGVGQADDRPDDRQVVGVVPRSAMKPRSILSSSTGSDLSWANELYPVPKSSMATLTPRS